MLKYKKYVGSIEKENNILCGHVLGLKNVIISYEGKDIEELKDDFQKGINDYLESCRVNGEQPEKTEDIE